MDTLDAEPVGQADLERELAWLVDTTPRPAAGLFGPGSVTWRVDREAALFLCAARALLLQLAHPWVAAGVATHSVALDDPVGRVHRTFGAVYAMVFGSLDQALDAARRLHGRHASVHGVLADAAGRYPAGTRYRANEVGALRWVHATLVDSAVVAWDLMLDAPLQPADLAVFWSESRRYAALFGIPQAALPADWTAFRAWFDATAASDAIEVTPDARRVATALLGLGDARAQEAAARASAAGAWRSRARLPRWYAALTAELLPAPVRAGFGLTLSAADEALATRRVAGLRRAYRWLPVALRHVGPYREAIERLQGRSLGRLTRASNRVWIGRPTIAPHAAGPAPRPR